MAFFKKVYAKLLGEEEEEKAPEKVLPPADMTPTAPREVPVEKVSKPMTAPNRSIELKIAKLSAFNEQVMEVADHLIAGRPVVLNLDGASKEATKRIIDFFSGVAYTIQGQLKPIAGSIYIVTPSSVDVSHESLLASAVRASNPPATPAAPATPVSPVTPTPQDGNLPSASLYDGF